MWDMKYHIFTLVYTLYTLIFHKMSKQTSKEHVAIIRENSFVCLDHTSDKSYCESLASNLLNNVDNNNSAVGLN